MYMSLLISSIFTQEEAARLQCGIPDLATLSENLLIPFSVSKLKRPAVAWLNWRWFLQRGFNLAETVVRAKVEQWIIDEFAYIVSGAGVRTEYVTHKQRIYFADRYGSTEGMSPHGGSGRVATVGHFQVKGVGITPLVGASGEAGHSHGCCSLAECVREAVYSEIMGAEFPYGAIPAIAIIDTGLFFSSPDVSEIYDQDVRRALLIRPSALRLAHIERAPMFRKSLQGFRNSQIDDSHRAGDIARAWHGGQLNLAGREVPKLELLIDRLAHQVAFAHIYRMFGGGVFSSNLTLFGELIDFGNAHVFPNWMSAHVLGHSAAFGSDLTGLLRVVHSLSFFLQKYNHPGEGGRPVDYTALVKAAYDRYIDLEILRLFDVESASPPHEDVRHLLASMRRLLVEERRNHVHYVHGKVPSSTPSAHLRNQIADGIAAANSGSSSNIDELLHLIVSMRTRRACGGELCGSDVNLWRNTLRYLDSRKGVDRAVLLEKIRMLVEQMRSGSCTKEDRVRIDDFIDAHICLSRRIWRNLPQGFFVLKYVSRRGSSALLCTRRGSDRSFVWLEGITSNGSCFLFDSEVPASFLDGTDVHVRDRTWFASLSKGYEWLPTEQGSEVLSKGCSVWLPPMIAPWEQNFVAMDHAGLPSHGAAPRA